MKTQSLLISLILFPLLISAQVKKKFEMTPAGFEDSVVLEYPNKADSTLYLATKLWAEYTISNPDGALVEDIHDQYLKYQVFVPQAIRIKNDGAVYKWDAMFDVEFRFKDNAIRYDVKIVELSSKDAPPFAITGGPKQWAFYSLSGKPYPLTSDARLKIENIVNDFVRGVSAYVNKDAENSEGD